MHQHHRDVRSEEGLDARESSALPPGRRCPTSALAAPAFLQLRADAPAPAPAGRVVSLDDAPPAVPGGAGEAFADVCAPHAAAQAGVAGAGGALPFHDTIQASFGRHDVGGVRAHVGGAAGDACATLGAAAYATGSDVAFAGPPDLHTAAHEAAHVVQQRGGVQLKGGVGEAGDPYERHADAVADQVVRGGSAEALLDAMAGSGGAPAVQRLIVPIGDLADAGHPDPISEAGQKAAVIETSTRRLHEASGDRTAKLSSVRKPLAGLGDSEELTILAHGGSELEAEVADTYGGYSPSGLATALVQSGLKESYAGVIYLNGCNTATGDPQHPSFATRFQSALNGTHGRSVAVRGNRGGSRVLDGGQTGIQKDDDDSQRAFAEATAAKDRLARVMLELKALIPYALAPDTLRDVDGGLASLGLDQGATTEQIDAAIRAKVAEKRLSVQADVDLASRIRNSDELFEPRPDLIQTLPPPRSNNAVLGRMVGVLVLGLAISRAMPPEYRALAFALAVAAALGLVAYDLRTR